MIEISLFNKINQNIVNIQNSEERLGYIIDITLRTRNLTLLNGGFITNGNLTSNTTVSQVFKLMQNITLIDLRDSAVNLKLAQTDLSLQTASMT